MEPIPNEPPGPGPLKVVGFSYMRKKNCEDHETSKFYSNGNNSSKLIVRRGRTFKIGIGFDRPFLMNQDELSLYFVVKSSAESKTIILPVNNINTTNVEGWIGWIDKKTDTEGKTIIVKIISSPAAIVGEYYLSIKTRLPIESTITSVKEPFIILFNPWREGDSVYLGDEKARDEYVLNDQGIIFQGEYPHCTKTAWNYFQFDEIALKVALHFLYNFGEFSLTDRADPILVSRHIGAIVNSEAPNGIVVGKWRGDFSDGKDPLIWQGSKAILEEYFSTKKPVKYGQCWVFSGIVCTLSRCLGIPCRVVTNYKSGIARDGSATINRFRESNHLRSRLVRGRLCGSDNNDGVWNFHVFNEVWMKRPDLSTEETYDGWNVIDGTPDETPNGPKHVGPSSVMAIKLGEIKKDYDSKWVYSQVNAREVDWHCTNANQLRYLGHSSDGIGPLILTKAKNSDDHENITVNYKGGGKRVLKRALEHAQNPISKKFLQVLSSDYDDLSFELLSQRKKHFVGSSFEVFLLITNHSDKTYTVDLCLHVQPKSFHGLESKIGIKPLKRTIIYPGKRFQVPAEVKWENYSHGLPSLSMLDITISGKVIETENEFLRKGEFKLDMPQINYQKINQPVDEKPFKFRLSLKNPLPISLTGGRFYIEGPDSSCSNIMIPCGSEILPNKEIFRDAELTPKIPGNRTISVKFWCRELNNIEMTIPVCILAATPFGNLMVFGLGKVVGFFFKTF